MSCCGHTYNPGGKIETRLSFLRPVLFALTFVEVNRKTVGVLKMTVSALSLPIFFSLVSYLTRDESKLVC